MTELFDEQLSRVNLMAGGDPTWDLSQNDCLALGAVLDEIKRLRDEVADTKLAAMLVVTNTPSAQQFAASILGALPGKVAEEGGDDETL